jgi:cob(I)alamin adenosyltransferase
MQIYTRTGDDGTTGLFFGGRVRKDHARPDAYGTVDEAQAFIGLARAEATPGDELDEVLVRLERDLWVLMAELATAPENRRKLTAGTSLVTAEMVAALEPLIDRFVARFDMPTDFVVPGGSRRGALLDVARTVVRRAERLATALEALEAEAVTTRTLDAPVDEPGDAPAAEAARSHVVPYLNRLSDLLWTLARWQDGTSLRAKDVT